MEVGLQQTVQGWLMRGTGFMLHVVEKSDEVSDESRGSVEDAGDRRQNRTALNT